MPNPRPIMEQQPEQTTPQQEETIFDERDFLLEGYDKHVRQARNALFIIAGLLVLTGLLSSLNASEEMLIYVWVEILIMVAAFVALGFWSKKKPYTAILIGLILFIAYMGLYIIIDYTNIFSGILVKIFIIVYLVKGLNNAREAQTIKEALGTNK